MRRKCFTFLSSVLDQHPDRDQQVCPRIWMNGHGEIIDATYLEGGAEVLDCLSNPYTSKSREVMITLGRQYTRALRYQTYIRDESDFR
jgi:hypothetical protein